MFFQIIDVNLQMLILTNILKSTKDWNNNSNGMDEFGFRILPTGVFSTPFFSKKSKGQGELSIFWTKTKRLTSLYNHWKYQFDCSSVINRTTTSPDNDISGDYSIRCVKDD